MSRHEASPGGHLASVLEVARTRHGGDERAGGQWPDAGECLDALRLLPVTHVIMNFGVTTQSWHFDAVRPTPLQGRGTPLYSVAAIAVASSGSEKASWNNADALSIAVGWFGDSDVGGDRISADAVAFMAKLHLTLDLYLYFEPNASNHALTDS